MGSVDLRQCASPGALADAVAAEFLRFAGSSPDDRLHIALSGGRIAAALFERLAARALQEQAGFNVIHFFWADERCVPSQDPESNFGLTDRLLFQPLRIPQRQIHRIRGEDDPATAARSASEELASAVDSSMGQPVLDLVLLGMGEDGHVASLFPGENEATISSPAIYRPVRSPKPPPGRITLGYPALSAARQAWVLISGNGKKDSFKRSLEPGQKTPLGRLLEMRRKTLIWTDFAA